jgi:hypothetical protein
MVSSAVGGAFIADEREQALVVFVAGRAAFEMRAHAGDLPVGVGVSALELDVAVEFVEASARGFLPC